MDTSLAGRVIFPDLRLDGSKDIDAEIKRMEAFIDEIGIGGFIVFGGQMATLPQIIQRLRKRSSVPLLVCADLEDGLGHQCKDVLRLPSNMALGAANTEDLAWAKGRMIGLQARSVGIDMVFAPVVDLNTNSANPIINTRAFGDDPEKTICLAMAMLKGMRDAGVLSCLKHFPGHGDVHTDSHLTLPVVNADLERLHSVELKPFRELLAYTDCIMLAHLLVPALDTRNPASLSSAVVSDLLQKQLGFTKLVVTDAMNMGALKDETSTILRALQAGCHVILYPHDARMALAEIQRGLQFGNIDMRVMERGVAQIDMCINSIASFPVTSKNSVTVELEQLATKIARRAITMLWGELTDIVIPDDATLGIVELGGENAVCEQNTFGRPLQFYHCCVSGENELVARLAKLETCLDYLVLLVKGRPVAFADKLIGADETKRIMKLLQGHCRKLIVVAVGSPYSLTTKCGAVAGIAVYDETPCSIASLVSVLHGECVPRGILPITIEYQD